MDVIRCDHAVSLELDCESCNRYVERRYTWWDIQAARREAAERATTGCRNRATDAVLAACTHDEKGPCQPCVDLAHSVGDAVECDTPPRLTAEQMREKCMERLRAFATKGENGVLYWCHGPELIIYSIGAIQAERENEPNYCDRCRGSGGSPENDIPCPDCNGTGEKGES